MLTNIDYKIDFSNGKSISNNQSFSEGSFLVTGRNGQGKSLLLEMFAFALFGSTALRGVATDYKKINVHCHATIRGVAYHIVRTKSSARVFNGETTEQLVDGTKPVNAWMVRTLGFNYSVFRVAHWCAQGDIQALASMKPTERKDMINSVTGLTQMEIMVESVVHRGRVAKAEIEALEGSLLNLTAPLKPLKGLEAAVAEVKRLRVLQDEVSDLSEAQKPEAPTEPVKPVAEVTAVKGSHRVYDEPDLKPVEVPEQFEGNTLEELKSLSFEMQSGLTLKQNFLKQFEPFKKYSQLVVSTHPELSLPVIDLQTKWYDWDKREQLERLKASKVIDCPKCKHSFHLVHSEIADLEALDLPTSAPDLTVSEWKSLTKDNENIDSYCKLKEFYDSQPYPEAEDYTLLLEYLKEVHKAGEEQKRQIEVKKSVKDFNDKQERVYKRAIDTDQENAKAQSVGYTSRMERYETKLTDYNAQLKKHLNKQLRLNEIAESFPNELHLGRAIRAWIQTHQNVLNEWQVYNQVHAQYLESMKLNDRQQDRITAKQLEMAEYNKARKALAEVKLRVQSYVVPSLNKVASYLVGEMTGGRHNKIELTPEFELLVDGDPLRTLSGSGKDIANIALRIALGRILTHSVLPVMMLDEVDSAMDDERANYTWACIQKITPQIGQVIQASHKELKADNRVEV